MARIRLKDVINRVQTKVDKDNTNLIYYVGGEHIESENVCITKRGLIEGSTIGPMFYYGFKAGDFLLVSRNPHLKKAGVVNFDGICSEKTFVLATADSSVLLSEYMPFVLQNDMFWEYACQHRHGSTNTFINWSTLANYEFELPDIETQRKQAEILWSINATVESYKKLIFATDELVKSQFIEWFGGNQCTKRRLDTVAEITSGLTKNSRRSSLPTKLPYLRVANVQFNKLDLMDVQKIGVEEKEIEKALLKKGDLLIVEGNGSPDQIGRVSMWDGSISPILHQNHIIKARFNSGAVLPDFAMYYYMTDEGRQQILDSAATTSGLYTLSLSKISRFMLPVPSIDKQQQFVEFARQSDKSKFELEQALSELTATYKRIISQQLG